VTVIDPYESFDNLMREPPMLAVTGYPGEGKSSWVGSILSHVPETLFIVCDKKGFRAAIGNPKVHDWYAEYDVPQPKPEQIIGVTNWQDFKDSLEHYILDPSKTNDCKYRAVVIDGASDISEFLTEEYEVDDPSVPPGLRIQGWGAIKREWRLLFRQLNQAGLIVVFTVHMRDKSQEIDARSKAEKASTDEREYEKWIVPDIAGSGMWLFLRTMDGYFHLERTGSGAATTINVYVESDGDIFGKSRADYGDSKLMDVTLGKMLELGGYLQGEK